MNDGVEATILTSSPSTIRSSRRTPLASSITPTHTRSNTRTTTPGGPTGGLLNIINVPNPMSMLTPGFEDDRIMNTSSDLLVPITPGGGSSTALGNNSGNFSGQHIQRYLEAHQARQMKLNQANAQLHYVNLLLNYSNASKYNELREKYHLIRKDIKQGQVMLQNLQHDVEIQAESLRDLESHVTTLSTNVSEQGRLYDDLSVSVNEQRAELQRAMEAYDVRLSQQEKLIRDQDDVLKRLLSVRFRIDFVVDLVIVCIAYAAASSRVVVWPATLIAALMFPSRVVIGGKDISPQDRRRRHNNARLFLFVWRLSVFFAVVRYCRYLAVKNGLHNLVGDYRSYFAFAKSKSTQLAKSYWGLPTTPSPSPSPTPSPAVADSLPNLSEWSLSYMGKLSTRASKLWESAGDHVLNFMDDAKRKLNPTTLTEPAITSVSSLAQSPTTNHYSSNSSHRSNSRGQSSQPSIQRGLSQERS